MSNGNQHIKSSYSVGRIKTVLVANEGPAVISTIIAQRVKYIPSPRIVLAGPCKLSNKIMLHLDNIILPQIDKIHKELNIPLNSYRLSVLNIDAISSLNVEYTITGYSADVSLFLVLLSAGLQIPINQNQLFTGHISSIDGDISQVKDLIKKIKVAENDRNITSFFYPCLKNNSSQEILKPNEFQNTFAYISRRHETLSLIEIVNTYDLVIKSLNDESILLGSLNSGFYRNNSAPFIGKEALAITTYLQNDNEKRIWQSIERNLLSINLSIIKKLLDAYIDFYIEERKYPMNFGKKLRNILISMPPSICSSINDFILISKEQYIKLIQYAQKEDFSDISHFYEIVFELSKLYNKSKHFTNDNNFHLIDYIIQKLNPNYIDIHITQSIDNARLAYIFPSNSAESYDDLLETISRFLIHVYRYVNEGVIQIDEEKSTIEALSILQEIYPSKGAYNNFISNGLNAYNGGLRVILDNITKHLKTKLSENYITAIIDKTINPLDYDQKKRLIQSILEREKNILNIAPDKLNSAKYVEDYREIIRAYAYSKQMLNPIFTRL